MRVGLLTGGGDCPGLNAVIRAIVQRITTAGGSCLGFLEGWKGVVQGQTQELTVKETDGIISWGGTILGSSRTNPYKHAERDVTALRNHFAKEQLDALIAIGGDDTLGVANRLYKDFDMPIVGIPKTIDNDLMVTDFTFGFDTAINIVVEAVDRLRTTIESHRRIVVVETMGRHSGWIACFAGIAAGADFIMIPEVPANLDQCIHVLKKRRQSGKNYGIVVVSEGVELTPKGAAANYADADPYGNLRLSGIANVLAKLIQEQTGFDTRSVVLGHIQRGGPPSAYDRILATRMGLAASNTVLNHRFGTMVALSGNRIIETALSASTAACKTLDLTFYHEAQALLP